MNLVYLISSQIQTTTDSSRQQQQQQQQQINKQTMASEVEKVVKDVVKFAIDDESSSNSDWASKYSNFIYTVRTQYFPSDIYDPVQKQKLGAVEIFDYKAVTGGCEFLDIILLQTPPTPCPSTSISEEITLRIDLRRFMLVGYKMNKQMNDDGDDDDDDSGSSEKWFEFGHHWSWRRMPLTHKIPGSSFMEWNGYLNCLEHQFGLPLNDILLGYQQLRRAINLLATSRNRKEIAWALIVLRVMICEAIRYVSVSNHFTSTFPHSLPLPPHLVYFLHSVVDDVSSNRWLSMNHVIRSPGPLIRDYQSPRPLKPCVQRPHIGNAESLKRLLAKQPGNRLDLLEVFSICIYNINRKRLDDCFYGTIYVKSSLSTECIYKKERKELTPICSGDELLVSGPSSCILVMGDFGFRICICGEKVPYTETHIDWKNFGRKYNMPLCDEFAAADFSVMLRFIVLSDAVQVNVEVTVLTDAHVYGKISALSDKFLDDYEVVLFQKTRKEHVEVLHHEPLKLLRSVVAVPWGYTLIIRADLYAENDGKFSPFAKGFANFPKYPSGQAQVIISEEILVKVTQI